jgi:Protein of unknown function (DUF2806)
LSEYQTDAKSVVTKALATAAAEHLTSDPALVERAARGWLSKELRAQSNKEEVARRTIEYLTHEPPATQAEEIDADWLNLFERYAEDASSERLQDLWARVLAGQLRTPRAFSLKTLRFVAELDFEIASIFEKWANAIVDWQYIGAPIPQGGQELSEALQMQDFGLITGVGGVGLANHLTVMPSGMLGLRYRKHGLAIFAPPGALV